MVEDCELLLALLNTRPITDGVEHDELSDDRSARRWSEARGGTGTTLELRRLRRLREHLTHVVLGQAPVTVLAEALEGAHQRPSLSEAGLSWELVTEPDMRLSARVVLAWAWVNEHLPGRLRPCGNDECQLFLLDRSKANKARWCSMATCGNRMKARRHYERIRSHVPTQRGDQ
ncbi:CGNR zinc finger domain-containing protein [Saccharopolyspora phatthalungensis]|uniref:Putative RNA-binding Zn ribbon-like protein n=1 Tax=Saccharopolyspora phatthalungensis TaxID=664693 RepID=A0A840Q9Z0_9PSEU|nr:CGNR zinc finger domain-containing protein [Saccharopolyspora phatthalungensis]MBB5159352.1 putative RNA-binding Zn ribbon-like protein [Saccharopolyspora phatthalungensis]